MGWRDIKRQMRQTVHATMRLRCWRVRNGLTVATWGRLHVARTNNSNDAVGDLMSQGYAERASVDPTIVFMVSENMPMKGDIYVFEPGEAYRVDDNMPSYDTTITSNVERLPAALLSQLPPLTWPIPDEV